MKPIGYNAYNFLRFSFIFVINLVIELLVALAFLRKKKISYKILDSVVWANVISLPLFHFFFSDIRSFLSYFLLAKFSFRIVNSVNMLAVLVGETLVFVFEALFIYYTNKGRITLKESFGLSFATNLVSFLLGISIFRVFIYYYYYYYYLFL